MNKRGLSEIVTGIILILLALVAIGILWGIYYSIINDSSSQINVQKFTISTSIIPQSVQIYPNKSVSLIVKRNSGLGDLFGLKFVLNDGVNSYSETVTDINLKVLESKVFFINGNGNIPFDSSKFNATIAVVPILKSKNGKEFFGERSEVYNFFTKLTSVISTSSRDSSSYITSLINQRRSDSGVISGSCIPSTCTSLSKQCGSWVDGCGGNLNCGVCSSGLSCNVNGLCQQQSGSIANYVIEQVQGVNADVSTHITIPLIGGSAPSKGNSVVDSITGIKWTRISDVADIPSIPGNSAITNNYVYQGNPGRGLTNGYDTYSDVNVNSQLALAYGVQPWITVLYNLNTGSKISLIQHKDNSGNLKGIGETNNIRWDLSGIPGTENDIYYQYVDSIYKQNVLTGQQTLIHSFVNECSGTGCYLKNEDHMSQSKFADYRGYKLCSTTSCTTGVLNLKSGNVLSGKPCLDITSSSIGCGIWDVSPDGDWFVQAPDYYAPVPQFYKISDLTQGITTPYRIFPGRAGHAGWAYDKNGDEVFTFQDTSNDWFGTYNPKTGERIDIIKYTEFMLYSDATFNQHLSRIENSSKKGWFMMSTYVTDNSRWSTNQIFLIEILPAAQHPRIWRISSTNNKFNPTYDQSGYFTQAFANVDPSFNNIYIGSNWNGSTNLELYKLELPRNWDSYLADAPTVSFNSPNEGDTVWGNVSINVNAQSTSGISRVELYVNNQLFSTDTTSPYSFIWDSTKVPDGNVVLRIDAYSVNGNKATSTRNVVVNNLGNQGLIKITLRYGIPVSQLGIVNYTGMKDTRLDGETPNAGYYEGGNATIIDYRYPTRVGLYWFDLSSIPSNAVIGNASLVLYSTSNSFDIGGSIPIYLVQTLTPNNNVIWVEGNGSGYYDQYGGTSWLSKSNVINPNLTQRYNWSNNAGRFVGGDLASAYQSSPIGNMNFVSSSGLQYSTNISSAIQNIINNNYKYEGFAVDKYGISDTSVRKDAIAMKEYSDATVHPALEITYKTF